ncbi:hypothetical protein HPB49_000352 [Dermacentor silvarum]|uniref:Uncharacterized protein n=1 Tax=Dermacentor silvarum TaxID=543639 RepID=A0ACB8D997_DERSI|nr:hypothetical protein HPB49_000352 [Dermacentor silvarum]
MLASSKYLVIAAIACVNTAGSLETTFKEVFSMSVANFIQANTALFTDECAASNASCNNETIITVDDLRRFGLPKLNKMVRDYYESGADQEQTLRENVEAFKSNLMDGGQDFFFWTDVSKLHFGPSSETRCTKLGIDAPPSTTGGRIPEFLFRHLDQDREKGPQQSKKVKTSLLLTQSQGFALATKVPHTGRTPCQVEESAAQEGRGRAAPWFSQQHSRSTGLEQPGTREAWLPFWRSSHHRSHWAPRIAQEQQAGITGSQVSSGSRSDPPRPGVSRP